MMGISVLVVNVLCEHHQIIEEARKYQKKLSTNKSQGFASMVKLEMNI